MAALAAHHTAVVEERRTGPAEVHRIAGAEVHHIVLGEGVRHIVQEAVRHIDQVEAGVGLVAARRTGLVEARHIVRVGELRTGLEEGLRIAVVGERRTGPAGERHIAGVEVHRTALGEAADPTAGAEEEVVRILAVAGVGHIPVVLEDVSFECAAGVG
jgi:hypothetical protein